MDIDTKERPDNNPAAPSTTERPANTNYTPRAAATHAFVNTPGQTEHIDMVEADPSLTEFPPDLRVQLERYMRKDGANVKTFSTTGGQFRIHSSAGKSMRFVEPGTRKFLDVGRFRYGLGPTSAQIVVVKGRGKSQFNSGKAAIIAYYGKLVKKGACPGDHGSRWAIWSPEGMRKDIMVHRIRVHESEVPDHNQSSAADQEKKICEDDKGESSAVGVEPKDGGCQDGLNAAIVKVEEALESVTTQKRKRSSESQVLPWTRRVLSLPRAQIGTPTLDPRHPTSVISPLGIDGLPTTSLDRPSNSAILDKFLFKSSTDEDTSVIFSKTRLQCNNVQKLFAYAFKAGLLDSEVMILSCKITDLDTIDVVRDDEEDFALLTETIRETKEVLGGNEQVVVEVVPIYF